MDAVGLSTTPSAPASSQFSTATFDEWFRAAQDSAVAIGRMPPCSPTVRSRIGAFLVRVVRRMLFWYTPQIVGFNTAVLSAIQEQNHLIQQLAADVAANLAAAIRDENRAREGDRNTAQQNLERLVAADEGLLRSVDAVQGRLNSSIEETTRQVQELLKHLRSGDIARENADRRWQANEAQTLQLRTMLLALERRPAMSGRPDLPDSAGPVVPHQEHVADNLYLMLEDRFRGAREEIKVRLTEYLPYVKKAGADAASPVLDIGCGRGEWLELLRESGIPASGVDLNGTFVSYCSELGLAVTLGDVVNDLRGRAGGSLGVITGFHIVEHLPWLKLVELIDETVRVLKPGGLAIFETPNPANVLVGSCNFYLDPTHRNPLPALLLQFLLEARGLSSVEVLPLHPCPDSVRVPADGSAITGRFNEYFFGPLDYGIIARKV